MHLRTDGHHADRYIPRTYQFAISPEPIGRGIKIGKSRYYYNSNIYALETYV